MGRVRQAGTRGRPKLNLDVVIDNTPDLLRTYETSRSEFKEQLKEDIQRGKFQVVDFETKKPIQLSSPEYRERSQRIIRRLKREQPGRKVSRREIKEIIQKQDAQRQMQEERRRAVEPPEETSGSAV